MGLGANRPAVAPVETVDDLVRHGASVAGLSALSTQALQAVIEKLFYGEVRVKGSQMPPLSSVAAERKTLQADQRRLDEERKVALAQRDACEGEVHRLREEQAREDLGVRLIDKVSLAIMLLFLLPLTAFLVLFYVSVAYNAFMFAPLGDRVFANSAQLASAAILNPRAWAAAVENPVLFMYPSVFLALGYLLHVAHKRRAWAGMVLLLAVTLAFDGLLAAEVVRRLHDAQYLLGNVAGRWVSGQQFRDSSFYIILSAGFVTYVIWGFLLSQLLGAVEKLSPGSFRARLRHAEERLAKVEADQAEHTRRAERLEERRVACEGAFDRFRTDALSILQGFQRAIAAQWAGDAAHCEALTHEAQQVHDQVVTRLMGQVR